MRERTTWNRQEIAKAAGSKKADDPSVLNNPDHLKQQPSADKYLTGGPSDFAEDVASPNWKAEYSGGEVKRNEIGMPEFRGETFNHAEKTAGQQGDDEDDGDDFLEKKADVCINLAKRMLPKTASEQMIEDQAFAFMHMPDAQLIETANRLAQQQDDGDDQGQQQSKQAQQQDDGQDDKGQQQSKQAQQQDQGQGQDDDKKQAAKKAQQQDQGQDDQGQDKQAGQIPENFKKKKDDDGDEDDKKQASKVETLTKLAQQACAAMGQGDMMSAQQAIQQMVQQAQQQGQPMDQVSQQVQQLVQQAMQQMQGQQQPQAPMAQQTQMADDQLLDQMLQQPQQQQQQMMASASPASLDLQLEGQSMDMSEIKLGSEDEALTALFASHTEVREAAQAQSLQGGAPAAAPMTRTAATKTVGTRPSGGVSQLGGGASGEPAGGGEIDKLSGLWSSAPDVKNVFG